jgi:hypothetical protein
MLPARGGAIKTTPGGDPQKRKIQSIKWGTAGLQPPPGTRFLRNFGAWASACKIRETLDWKGFPDKNGRLGIVEKKKKGINGSNCGSYLRIHLAGNRFFNKQEAFVQNRKKPRFSYSKQSFVRCFYSGLFFVRAPAGTNINYLFYWP